ncbi:MAG: carboxypeptidase-like regulatory domain-containing protein [Bacteroidales bacterium]
MSRFFKLLLGMSILYGISNGQSLYELKGSIVDENKMSLPGASVFLYPINKGTTTDLQGKFVINKLQEGTYKIEVSFMGYQTLADTITISEDTMFNAQLNISVMSLNEVVVSDNYIETRKKKNR